MSALTILLAAGALITVLGGTAGMVGVVILWGKQKANEAQQTATESSVATLATANAELRAENIDQRNRHDEKIAALRQELVDERVSCSRLVGELQGQITALTGPLAEQIVAAAAAAAARVANAAATAADVVIATAAAATHPTRETS